jgi:ribose 5-phosphate isomerase B
MKIAVGSDHAGFPLKGKVLDILRSKGHEITDYGSYDLNPVDFPDIAKKVCAAILDKSCERGIMFCGTGVGACIACNKISGIRASVCHDIYTAHQCVEHDDVQVIAMGGQIIGHTVALELIDLFLEARFSTSEEFRRRVKKLEQMDGSIRETE